MAEKVLAQFLRNIPRPQTPDWIPCCETKVADTRGPACARLAPFLRIVLPQRHEGFFDTDLHRINTAFYHEEKKRHEGF